MICFLFFLRFSCAHSSPRIIPVLQSVIRLQVPWIKWLSLFCVMCTSLALEWRATVLLSSVSSICHCMAILNMYHLNMYHMWSLNYNHKLEMWFKKKKLQRKMLHLRSNWVILCFQWRHECGCITPRFSNPQNRGELSQGANEKSGRPAWIQKLKTKMCTVVYPY